MSTIQPPTSGGVKAALAKLPGAYVNVRSEPDATASTIRGTLNRDEVVTAYVNDSSAPGWVYVEAFPVTGWVSLQNGAVQFVPELLPVPTPTPTPTPTPMPTRAPEPVVTLTLAQYNALFALSKSLSAALEEVKPPASTDGGF